MPHIKKYNLTLRRNSTLGRTYRTADMIGELVGFHVNNVSFTSDMTLNIFRSSSTHKSQRIAKILAHGTTQIMFRPRFPGFVGGSTTFTRTSTWKALATTGISYAAIKMELGDEPIVVVTGTAAAPKGTTLICHLTFWIDGSWAK